MSITQHNYKNGTPYYLAIQRKGSKLHVAEGGSLLEAMRECLAMVTWSKIQEAMDGSN